MKQTLAATMLALVTTLALGPAAHAAGDDQRAAAKQKWESMTPEEQAAAKEKMKQKWDAMTPEQQAEAKKKHPRAARMAAQQKEAAAASAASN